ncbi:MAG: hypothetical protein GY705_06690 [Bacteroidetes bacterium]|nr:hypothetical protein [Bacteroidota bacterium]
MKSKYYFISLLLFLYNYTFAQNENNISLDGNWEIVFDYENEGKESEWQLNEKFETLSSKREITVPGCWELMEKDYEGVAFYRKKFDVPENWEGKVIRLKFGAVNYLSEVWLNNEVVGFHEGGFTPFEFRVDEMIKAGGSNVLTLRVVGPIILSNTEIDGVKALETPQWRGGITGGIWQSVNLAATDDVYIDDVFIEPKISDNTAIFHVQLDHTAIKGLTAEVEIDVFEANEKVQSVAKVKKAWQLHPGKNKQSWTVEIQDTKYWSPDSPNLYLAKVKVFLDGKISDHWSERFGMRELTIKNRDFYLNGKPIYIKASFFEGLYPKGIAYPDSEAMARKEIRLAKEAGFNMIRPWRHPPAPMWLDLADEMGVLVVGSPALECMTLPLSTPYLPARVENELRESILRDRNRACIVQWELFNEVHRPVLKQMMRPMALLTRSLDPTRLILDESGGWAFGANMYLPYEFEPTKFNDIHNYPGPFINETRYDGYLSIGLTKEEKKARGFKGATPGRNVVPGLMSCVSELGYGSLPDLTVNNERFKKEGNSLTPVYRYHKKLAEGQKRVLKESGFSGLYPDMQQFYLDQQSIHGTANKRMIEAVRANPEVDGYCIHALVAGDWIMGAGLLDLWRNPKSYAYEATKDANQPRILSVRMIPRNVYAEKGANLEIIGINELEKTNANLVIEIVDKKGKSVYKKTLMANWKQGISSLFQSGLSTKRWKGNYELKVRMKAADGSTITENSYAFDVFTSKDLRMPKAKLALLDLDGPLASFLKRKNVKVKDFDSSTPLSTPVFVTSTNSKSKQEKERFEILFEFVRKGGTAIYIEGTSETIEADNPAFPFTAIVHPARGLWTCIPHLVRRHTIFEGLPSNTMMRDVYENVWATSSLRDIKIEGQPEIEPIVASIGYDWFSKDHKMHYSGPGDAWWGSDMVIVPYGKGRILVSQLSLTENLDEDPVADKILSNLIQFLNKSNPN